MTKLAHKTSQNIVANAATGHSIDERTLGNYLLTGDVTALSPDQRAQLLVALAKHIGVDAIARPFMLIPDGKRVVIYARAECADALSRRHGIDTDTIEIGEQTIAGTRQIVAKVLATIIDVDRLTHMISVGVPSDVAVESAKRRRSATSAIPVLVQETEWTDGPNGKRIKVITGLREPTGEEVANMLMKAETKAGRRAIFKLVSLGGIALDADGDIESRASSGEIVDAYSEPRPAQAKWTVVTEAFARYQVTQEQLLAHLAINSTDEYSDDHHASLQRLAAGIRSGDQHALSTLDQMRAISVEFVDDAQEPDA